MRVAVVFFLSALVMSVGIFVSSSAAAPALFTSVPQYGDTPELQAERKKDAAIVAAERTRLGSDAKALEFFVAEGFSEIQRGAFDKALSRFNQAWQVAPDDFRVRWGFGVVSAARQQFDESLGLFKRARDLNPNEARLLSDYGLASMRSAMLASKSKDEYLKRVGEAHALFIESIALDPKNEYGFSGLAILELSRGNPSAAWDHVTQAENLGGRSIDKRFIEELTKVMPRPKRSS